MDCWRLHRDGGIWRGRVIGSTRVAKGGPRIPRAWGINPQLMSGPGIKVMPPTSKQEDLVQLGTPGTRIGSVIFPDEETEE